jgi:peroxiredoxin Q/BCP
MKNINLKNITENFEAIQKEKGFVLNFSSFLDKMEEKYLVLYFYPKDLTPGCSSQAENLSLNYENLKENGIEIIGVSIDDINKHKKFIEKYNIPFILISDIDKKLVEYFGVWVEKNMYGKKYMGTKRTSFIFHKSGELIKIIDKVKVKEHSNQILKEIDKLD